MTHYRKALRTIVVGRLTGNVTLGGSPVNVYDSRIWPYVTMPAVSVFTQNDERADFKQLTPRIPRINIELEINVIVQANETFMDDLDAVCEQIDPLLPDFMDAECIEAFDYAGTSIEATGEAEQPIAVARILYEAKYYRDRVLADETLEPLADLIKVYTDWDIASPSVNDAGPDGHIDAQDRIEDLDD